MGLNRPHKPTREEGPFQDPNDRTYDLGLMKVTLHKEDDHYHDSAITLRIASEKDSLLEPNYAHHSKQPSEADKVIFLTKEIMRKTGMTLIDGNGGPMGQNPTGMPENRVKLALMEFASYKPGSSGITIRAERGMYPDAFNGDAMMHEAGVALERIARLVKEAPTPTSFRERLDPAFDDVDFYNKPLEEALLSPQEKDAAREKARQDANEASLKNLIGKYVPKADMTAEVRNGVIETIAKGVLCSGEACWTKGDRLEGKVRETLQNTQTSKPISAGALDFIVDEMCSKIRTHQRGTAIG
jgi:hypothetical protein